MPAHREFSHVVFRVNDNVVVVRHLAMMFGNLGSVHHWERVGKFANSLRHVLEYAVCFVGELLKVIGRRVLHLPLSRFVDDYFGAERKGCAEHAMNIFAR